MAAAVPPFKPGPGQATQVRIPCNAGRRATQPAREAAGRTIQAAGRTTRIVLAGVVALVLAGPASAFDSFPEGDSVHDHITADAAHALGWQGDAVTSLQQAVRRPDNDEVKLNTHGKALILDANLAYAPYHHCDRLPSGDSGAMFLQAAAYVHLERDQAILFAKTHSPERAMRSLGNALHALQDCHSHSNLDDLDDAAQAGFRACLLQTCSQAPPDLLLTGWEPGGDPPEFPAGDRYPHGAFAKDGVNGTTDAAARLPDGRTKFEAAAHLAEESSRRLLREVEANLTSAELGALRAVPPSKVQGAAPVLLDLAAVVAIPLATGLLGVAIGAGAMKLRRRRQGTQHATGDKP